jgi:hypothetical protein
VVSLLRSIRGQRPVLTSVRLFVSLSSVHTGRDADFRLLAASGTVKKVIEINPYLLGTMAGGAGAFLHSSLLVFLAR